VEVEGVPDLPSRGIFLSYRREDAAAYARLLKTEFSEHIPNVRVFMDLDSIRAGRDFAEVIQEALDSSAVLVVLIGRQWTTLTDEEGQRKLDNPDDWVRFEVKTAFERGVGVLPVLVDGAKPPRQQQLPSELYHLARLNAFELGLSRYQYDADRLVDLIREMLAEASGTMMAHQSAPEESADGQSDGNVSSYEPPEEPGVAWVEPHCGRVLNDAERIARSITDKSSKARALANVARVLAVTEPDRAAWLAADAERIAPFITSKSVRANVFADIAGALAATDPGRGERIALSITDESSKARALAYIVRVLAATDPDRGARLIAAAESIVLEITDTSSRSCALASIARILAATEPDRAARLITTAEHLAQGIADKSSRVRALASIARVLAATDADRAENIARTIPDRDRKAGTLAYIARVLAATDPERAARLRSEAERMVQRWLHLFYVTLVAADVRADFLGASAAIGDADRAEHSAKCIRDDSRTLALVAVAEALAATNPDRAERIAKSSITSKLSQVQVLLTIAEASSAEP
jgi:hypothetical protein